MENIIYKITFHNGDIEKFDKHTLKHTIDDILSDISELAKTYIFNNKKHRLILFSIEHDFTANEYIEHYQSLSNKYGNPLLSQFDISLIHKLNDYSTSE